MTRRAEGHFPKRWSAQRIIDWANERGLFLKLRKNDGEEVAGKVTDGGDNWWVRPSVGKVIEIPKKNAKLIR